MLTEEDQTTSAVFDGVSEYYLNFGIVGVFFLSVLQGAYWRILHRWLIERSDLSLGAPILVVLLFVNFDCFGIGQTILSHTRQLPVWLLISYVLSGSSTSGQIRAARDKVA